MWSRAWAKQGGAVDTAGTRSARLDPTLAAGAAASAACRAVGRSPRTDKTGPRSDFWGADDLWAGPGRKIASTGHLRPSGAACAACATLDPDRDRACLGLTALLPDPACAERGACCADLLLGPAPSVACRSNPYAAGPLACQHPRSRPERPNGVGVPIPVFFANHRCKGIGVRIGMVWRALHAHTHARTHARTRAHARFVCV